MLYYIAVKKLINKPGGEMNTRKKENPSKCGCDLKVTTQKNKKNPKWGKPELTDVSGRVMAQPYIRFT